MIWWPEEIPTLLVDTNHLVDSKNTLTNQMALKLIKLRPVRPSDAEAIYRGAQDPEVPKFTTLPANYTLDNAINFAKNRAPERHANRLELIFAIDYILANQNNQPEYLSLNPEQDLEQDLAQDPARDIELLAGIISLHSIDFANHRAEIGYWLVKEARNLGIGTASVELLTEYGLITMGFRRIDALVDVRNEASKRLLVKAGYQFEGTLKNYVTRSDGNQIDMAVFAATVS